MAKGVAPKAAPVKPAMWVPVFLKSIGAPVNQHNVSFLVSWWHREGGALTNNAKFNWLNTTHGQGFPSINSVGVKAYPNFQTGINQLKQVFSYYPNLTKSLQSGAVNLNDPGVQSDLNKWLSGNAKPGYSSYIQGIAQGMGQQPPFQPGQTPQQGVPGRQKASGGVTDPSPAAPVTPQAPQTFIAPNIGTLPGFVGAGEPLANMPGVPNIQQVILAQPNAPRVAAQVHAQTKSVVKNIVQSNGGTGLFGAKVHPKIIGMPYQGTHGKSFNQRGGSDNWESENAVDFSVPIGTPVYALQDGTIGSQFGSLGSGGRFAGLRLHLVGAQNEWYYAHLSRFAPGLKPGEHVKRGQLLGFTGEANGVPHLHLASKTGHPPE